VPEVIYKNQKDNSNKFWSYEILDDNRVTFRWGRIGLKGQEKTESFGSSSQMQRKIDQKIKEKERKGYVTSDKKDMQKETKKAEILGHQYKIQRVEYVAKRGTGRLSILQNYDPKHHVYVEVEQCWTREVKRYLLAKNDSSIIEGVAEDKGERTILFDSLRKTWYDSMVGKVRQILKDLATQVQAVVIKKFAAMGARKLALDDGPISLNASEVGDVYEQFSGGGGISKQAVSKFAALGRRKLDL
jgi:predicted DNA-binding WGR domain protein